jgi:large subunit ribosomal protein L16
MMRGRMRGTSATGNEIQFGDFGLQALAPVWMTARQIEAGRRAITRYVRRGGKLWIRVFPDKPITKKPLEVRQGSGKGPVEAWVCVVRPGRVIYEISGVKEEVAREAMRLAAHKLPIKTRFLKREEG